jgi:hypothetical protein
MPPNQNVWDNTESAGSRGRDVAEALVVSCIRTTFYLSLEERMVGGIWPPVTRI